MIAKGPENAAAEHARSRHAQSATSFSTWSNDGAQSARSNPALQTRYVLRR